MTEREFWQWLIEKAYEYKARQKRRLRSEGAAVSSGDESFVPADLTSEKPPPPSSLGLREALPPVNFALKQYST